VRLLPILLLSIPLYGFTPVKVTTQSAKSQNENFAGLAREIERRSLNQGGIVHQNLKISSSAHITGDLVVDGTIKTSAGSVSSSSTNTWTGGNTFDSTVKVSSPIILGDVSQLIPPNIQEYMLSMDGAIQSTGCVVALGMSDSTIDAVTTFTSTVSIHSGPLGVLAEICSPGDVCPVITHGNAFVAITGTSAIGNAIATASGVRCVGNPVVPGSSSNGGRFTTAGTGHQWIRVGAGQ